MSCWGTLNGNKLHMILWLEQNLYPDYYYQIFLFYKSSIFLLYSNLLSFAKYCTYAVFLSTDKALRSTQKYCIFLISWQKNMLCGLIRSASLLINAHNIYICGEIKTYLSGPSCSMLMTLLVNDSLKFTSSDTQICWNFFLLKKCE